MPYYNSKSPLSVCVCVCECAVYTYLIKHFSKKNGDHYNTTACLIFYCDVRSIRTHNNDTIHFVVILRYETVACSHQNDETDHINQLKITLPYHNWNLNSHRYLCIQCTYVNVPIRTFTNIQHRSNTYFITRQRKRTPIIGTKQFF